MKNPLRQLKGILKRDENSHSGLWYLLKDMETKDLIRFNKRTQEYNKKEGRRLFLRWLIYVGLSTAFISILALLTGTLEDPETEELVLCFTCLTGGMLMGGLIVINGISTMATEEIKTRLDKDMETYFSNEKK